MSFVPKLFLFAVILIVGYFVARFLCRLFGSLLERVGFDRLVERGGVKRALAKSKWDASDILSKVLYYFVMLFTLQLAFGVFGPNPISALLTSMVAYLPNVFVAGLILVVAGAVASGVKQIIEASFGGLRYGRFLATGAAIAVWVIGGFAALDQLNIAPAIVNGLFYAMLAVFVGSAIVAVGGGGIEPMREVWHRAMNRVQRELPRVEAQAQEAPERAAETGRRWEQRAEEIVHDEARAEHTTPRYEP